VSTLSAPDATASGQPPGDIVSLFVYGAKKNVPDYMLSNKLTDDGTYRAYRIISNHLGSPLMIVDMTDGGIVQRYEYTEFGEVTLVVSSEEGFALLPFGFAGGLYDEETEKRKVETQSGTVLTSFQIWPFLPRVIFCSSFRD